MRILALFHDGTVPSPVFREWAVRRGHTIDFALLGGGRPVFSYESYDALALLGCPVSEGAYQSLREDPWLRDAVVTYADSDRKILGISVGARLLAESLGAGAPTPCTPERGWFPVSPTASARACGIFPEEARHGFMAFHWHDQSLQLPQEALVLAKTPLSSCQVFAKGWVALGIQFHLECQLECVKKLIKLYPASLDSGCGVQSLKVIQSGQHHRKAMERVFIGMFDSFFGS